MQVLIVGGCVRDKLRGESPTDIDYVVVGSSPSEMEALGFQRVGAFPVFLHPETRDEYALARSEQSTGDAHTDFAYRWENVSIEEDLSRRDFTINAMAIDSEGILIDPYGGEKDLRAGVLRHVSDAFRDDPLRVLRGARFAASFGYQVAPETMSLMQDIVSKGMLETLSAERLWKETEKALMSNTPSLYFKVLSDCGALARLFPEIECMKGIPQNALYHAEGDVWTHTLMVLDEAAKLTRGADFDRTRALRIRIAALMHDFGKPHTPKELLWDEQGNPIGRHHGHEDPKRYRASMRALAKRIKMPKDYLAFADVVAQNHQHVHAIRKMQHKGLVRLFDRMRLESTARKDPNFIEDVYLSCKADNMGRFHMSEEGLVQPTDYIQGDYFKLAMTAISDVDVGAIMKPLLEKGVSVNDARTKVTSERLRLAKGFMKVHAVELDVKQR